MKVITLYSDRKTERYLLPTFIEGNQESADLEIIYFPPSAVVVTQEAISSAIGYCFLDRGILFASPPRFTFIRTISSLSLFLPLLCYQYFSFLISSYKFQNCSTCQRIYKRGSGCRKCTASGDSQLQNIKTKF